MPKRGGKETKVHTFTVGREASTGQFISVKKARSKPSVSVVERIPKPGYGDTSAKGTKKKK